MTTTVPNSIYSRQRSKTMRRINCVLILFGLLSVLDWAFTMWAIELGIATEANPFMAQLIALGGWNLMLAGKLASVAAIALLVHLLWRLGGWVPEWAAEEIVPVARGAAWAGIGLLTTGQVAVLVLNFVQLALFAS